MTASLSRFAASRPHLLLVTAAGGSAARLRVERLAREWGWTLAETPADADVLVVCGAAGDIEQHVGRLWDQLPGPRAQVRVLATDDLRTALLDARGRLIDPAVQRADVRRTERPPAAPPPVGGMDDMDEDTNDDTGGHDMGDMSGHDMSGHEGHDMSGMEMPAGLGMADRSPDRDGLKLDVLTVPWGPVLPWWPDGLIVTTVLQGDVVQSATVERLGSDTDRRAGWMATLAPLEPPAAAAVVRLDALVRLLGVAGWDGARLRCQRVRDALLAGEAAGRDLHRLARQVSGSRALARMTSGLRTSHDEDVAARYRRWLAETVAAVSGETLPPAVDEPHVLHQLPDLVTGTDVAGMRLVVASLDLALSGADSRTSAGV